MYINSMKVFRRIYIVKLYFRALFSIFLWVLEMRFIFLISLHSIFTSVARVVTSEVRRPAGFILLAAAEGLGASAPFSPTFGGRG